MLLGWKQIGHDGRKEVWKWSNAKWMNRAFALEINRGFPLKTSMKLTEVELHALQYVAI